METTNKKRDTLKNILFGFLILILAGVAFLLVFYYRVNKNMPDFNSLIPNNPLLRYPQYDGKSQGKEFTYVEINEEGFIPMTITITAGETVKWTNSGTKPHQVSPDPYPTRTSIPYLSDTEPLFPSSTLSYTFEKAGTYGFHDYLNPDFKLTVIVE